MRFVFIFIGILASIVTSACWSTPSDAAQNPAGPYVVGNARFTIISDRVLRMEYSPTTHFVDEPSLFAVNRNPVLSDDVLKVLRVQATAKSISIDTGHIYFTYTDDGTPFHAGNPNAVVNDLANNAETAWSFGQKNQHNLGGTLQNLDHVEGPVALPDGLIAQDGWAYLDDTNRLLFDVPNPQNNPPNSSDYDNAWVKLRDPKTDTIDGYFFGYGLDFKAALQSLALVSGPSPMPRRYTLGAWYSRWWPYTSNDYRAIVQQFHQHDFPLDMIVNDMDWHIPPGYTGYTWNSKLFPDGPQYLKDMHAAGLHVTFNDHPQGGVAPDESMYSDFMKAMGQDPALGATLNYDMGNKTYIDTLMAYTHTPLEKEGVDFWWLDWMGGENSPFNQIGWANELYFRHSQTSVSEKNLRGQSFSRWADWGDQRHPIHFSGDTKIDWPTLQFEIPFTSTASNSGAFFWSHDIGGFIDDNNPINGALQIRQGELIARWTQFGAVSAVLRLHSANKAWLDKRPWTYPANIEESMRRSFHLRSEIFPYIYSSAWQAHESSLPLVRPLYLEHPELAQAYTNTQEYYFGEGLLAAPIVTKGSIFKQNASQKVWFPPGRWYDWFSGMEHAALSEATIWDDLNSFPLFAKGGYPILMQPYTERMSGANPSDLIIRLYPGEDGETNTATLYEDDGETKNYLSGAYALTQVTFSQAQSVVKLTITPQAPQTAEAFHFQPSSRTYEIQYYSSTLIKSATVNGQPTQIAHGSDGMNKMIIPQAAIGEKFTVLMNI
jgi:alpha-glucosidase (family GH31 glycosyl hydrolase)